jgi:hypothetical protein
MKKNKPIKPDKLTFKQAVKQTPEVQNCFQSGLRAFGKHSSKIDLANQSKCAGSIDIDGCLDAQKMYPNDNRWDYAFDYEGKVYFVEVLSAYTNEVGVVLKKLQWLKDWLQQKAPEIGKLKADKPYYWIQSGRFAIPATSPQYRQAVQASILPIPKLALPRL